MNTFWLRGKVWRGTDDGVDPKVPTASWILQKHGYWTEFYGSTCLLCRRYSHVCAVIAVHAHREVAQLASRVAAGLQRVVCQKRCTGPHEGHISTRCTTAFCNRFQRPLADPALTVGPEAIFANSVARKVLHGMAKE